MQVGHDLVLAVPWRELEPFRQARGGRGQWPPQMSLERHPRERLGEQGERPVLAGVRGHPPVAARGTRGRRTGRGRAGDDQEPRRREARRAAAPSAARASCAKARRGGGEVAA